MALPRASQDSKGAGMKVSTAKRFSNLAIVLSIGLTGGAGLAGCCNDEKNSETATPVEVLQKIPDSTVQIKSVTRANYLDSLWGTVYTFEHDGHLFIAQYPNFMIHHPDCPCLKGLKRIEFETAD